jgi:hypothetical protein
VYPGNEAYNDKGKMRYPNDTHSWKMKGTNVREKEKKKAASLSQAVSSHFFNILIDLFMSAPASSCCPFHSKLISLFKVKTVLHIRWR